MKRSYLRCLAAMVLITLGTTLLKGQNYYEELVRVVDKEGYPAGEAVLKKWEKAAPNDPELYVAYFNYYISASKFSGIAIGTQPQGEDYYELTPTDSTQQQPTGYIYEKEEFDPELFAKAIDWIDKGIAKFPNRLDLRFGKIYMLGEKKDYNDYTQAIIKTIEYSGVNKNKWLWSENEPLDGAQEIFLLSLQDYQVLLYNTEREDLLPHMERIAQAVLKLYPDDIPSLSNLSIVYVLQKEYDKALKVLHRAEKLNPEDYVVLGNIAQAYIRKGDKANGKKYLELVQKYGDEEAKSEAAELLKEL